MKKLLVDRQTSMASILGLWRSILLGMLGVVLLAPTVTAVPLRDPAVESVDEAEELPRSEPAGEDEVAQADGLVLPLQPNPSPEISFAAPRGANAPVPDVGELVPPDFGEDPERPALVFDTPVVARGSAPIEMGDSGRVVDADGTPFSVRVPAAGGGQGRSVEFAPAPPGLAQALSPGGVVTEVRFRGFRESRIPGLSERSVGNLDLDQESGWELEIDGAALSEDLPQNMVDRMVVWIWSDCDSQGECRIAEPLPTDYNPELGTYRAELPAAYVSDAGGLVLTKFDTGFGFSVPTTPRLFFQGGNADQYTGLAPGVSGAAGTYGANDVASLTSWQVGSHTGYATTSIPIQVPPAVGPVPSIGLSYSSGSVDGMSVATNNQPSTIGLGWDQNQPTIRRVTRGCSTGSADESGRYTGNLCLVDSDVDDGFVLTMAGVGGRLVPTGETGTDHPRYPGASWVAYELETKNDFRIWKVQHDSAKGDGPGDTGGSLGEWWEVTTGDGTLYVFGRNWLLTPSGSLTSTPLRQNRTTDNSVELKSVQVAPVMVPGGVSGTTTGACNGSVCSIEIGWFLDQTIDTSGNLAMYGYRQETNRFRSKNYSTYVDMTYDRAVEPWWVDYGIRFGDSPSPQPSPSPGVEYGPRFRVVYGYLFRDDNGTWHDTPVDLMCDAGTSCEHESPSFFTQLRLVAIQTYAGSQTSFRYNLASSWPSTPDTSERKLWLDSVQQSGPGTANPPITFDEVFLQNRVNPSSSPMSMPRIETITTELGGEVTFQYGQPRPPVSSPSTHPCYSGPDDPNGYVRMPCNIFIAYQSEYEDSNGYTNPGGFVLFNNYVVTSETRAASYGAGTETQVLNYSYDTPPDWAYSGQWGHTEHHTGGQCKAGWGCNLWNDYRGHRQVTVTDGDGTETTYQTFTGMADDRYSIGNNGRLIDVQPSNAANNITDFGGTVRPNLRRLAARTLSHRVTDNQGHTRTLVTTLFDLVPSQSGGYPVSYRPNWRATYTQAGDAVSANIDHNHKVVTYFDTYTRLSRVVDFGSIINPTTADDTTTFHQYYANTNDWIVSLPRLISTRPGEHTTNPWGGWVSATSLHYDNQAYSTAPVQGRVTREQVQLRMNTPTNANPVWSTTDYTYTARGQLDIVNPVGAGSTNHNYHATWGYRTSINGPLANDTTTFVVDQRHGGQTSIDGPDTPATTLGYDGLGRLTSVRTPGAPDDSYKFTYNTSARPAWVATRVLRAPGSYVPTYELMDGFGRTIQTQAPTANGNTSIASTNYANNGAVRSVFAPIQSSGAPNGSLRTFSLTGTARTTNTYTSEGRVTTTAYTAGNTAAATSWVHNRGNQSYIQDANGNQTVTTLDVWGNPTRITDPGGGYSTFDYNVRRQLIRSTDQGFDGGGNRAVIETQYDNWEIGPTRLVDPDLGTITYSYDSLGRLRTQDDQANPTLTINYNDASQPTSITTGGTTVTSWAYSTTGRLNSSTHHNIVGGNSKGVVTKAYSYDPSRGWLDGTTWTIPGLAQTQTIGLTYRESGQIDTITYPDNQIADFGFDSLDRQVSLTLNATTLLADQVGYTPRGQVDFLSYGQPGTQAGFDIDYTYQDWSGRIDTMVATGQGGGIVQNLDFDWEPNGNLDSVRDTAPGVNQLQCFAYDSRNQLTGAYTTDAASCTGANNAGPDPYNVSYNYHPNGNINTANGTGTLNATYNYGARPHAVTSAGTNTYQYNARGNATQRVSSLGTQTLVYDIMNRLVGINGAGPDMTALYDADGVRVKRVLDNTTNYYIGESYEIVHAPTTTQPTTTTTQPTTSTTQATTSTTQASTTTTSGGTKTITVRAKSFWQTANFEVEANGTVVGSAAVTAWEELDFTVPAATGIEDLRILFSDSPNATLSIKWVRIDGVTHYADDPDVLVDGYHTNGSCQPVGNHQTEIIKCAGWFDFTALGSGGGTTTTTQPTTTTTQATTTTTQATTTTTSGSTTTTTSGGTQTLIVQARSTWSSPSYDVVIGGVIEGSQTLTNGAGWVQHTYTIPATADISDIVIDYPIDNGTLELDWIELDGETYQAEGPDVINKGDWVSGQGCLPPGTHQTQQAECVGYWDFANVTPPPAGPTITAPGTGLLFAAPPGYDETIRIHHAIAGYRIGTTTNGTYTAALTDHLGSNTANRDSAGATTLQRHTPFGAIRGGGPNGLATDHTFTGQTDDPGTGLIDYNARHYDPTLGRFIVADTVLDGLNRYTYVRNNPLSYVDPSGHCIESFSYNDDGSFGFVPMRGAECWKGDQQHTDGSYAFVPGTGHDTDVRWYKYTGPMVGFATWDSVGDVAADLFRTFVFDERSCRSGQGTGGSLDADLGCGAELLLALPFARLAKLPDKASPLLRAADGAACSFAGETRVLMADGSLLPISSVRVGDYVLAFDPETEEGGPRRVTALWAHMDFIYELELSSGVLRTTEDHPFWNSTDRSWQRADELSIGDWLLTPQGSIVSVEGILVEEQVAPAFNLSVEDLRTYFVVAGDEPVLVHNISLDCLGLALKIDGNHRTAILDGAIPSRSSVRGLGSADRADLIELLEISIQNRRQNAIVPGIFDVVDPAHVARIAEEESLLNFLRGME